MSGVHLVLSWGKIRSPFFLFILLIVGLLYVWHGVVSERRLLLGGSRADAAWEQAGSICFSV